MAVDDTTTTPPATTTGAPPAETTDTGATTTVPTTTPVEEQKFPDIKTLIPKGFEGKQWVTETKDVPKLFKRVDDLLTEIGKKPTGIPGENAKPEEIAAFHKAFGVPEKPEEYKFPDPPAGLVKNEKFEGKMKEIFKTAGVSAKQAATLVPAYNALVAEISKELGAAGEQADVDFDKLAGETFGPKKEAVLKNSKALIAKYAPPQMAKHLEGLSNENLIVMAGVIDAIRAEFISDDKLPEGGTGGGVGMTAEAKRAKGMELMASKAYQDPFHPEHAKVKAEVDRLYNNNT